MWGKITNIILRNRILIISILSVITVVMGYFGTKVGIDYHLPQLLPNKDATYVAYEDFKAKFGEEGNIIVVGYEGEDLFELNKFQKWYELGNKLKKIKHQQTVKTPSGTKKITTNAVDSVFSAAHLFDIYKNTETKTFELQSLLSKTPSSQKEVDSVRKRLNELPFYDEIVYHDDSQFNVMMVFVNQTIFNSKDRGTLVEDITNVIHEYDEDFPGLRVSGLPYIRDLNMRKVKGELGVFVGLALLVTSILLMFFFKSVRVMLVAMLVVSVGVIWSFGLIGIFDYKITVLMGLIPPLIIVIGVPNCIYLINKYQQEYRTHGNKAKALSRVIQKVGNATFMTNATTALGFATFVFTKSNILIDFGIVSSINIMLVFLLSILIIPIVYSYMKPPSERHTRHLDKKWLDWVVDQLVSWSLYHRKKVYVIAVLVILLGGYGLTKMHTTGNIVDDLPKDDKVLLDLHYFESRLDGIMPFEVIIDTKVKNRIFKEDVLEKIEAAQMYLAKQDILSKSISVVDAIKFLNQSYYGGNPKHFELKNETALRRINAYLENSTNGSEMSTAFSDSSFTSTRISAQVKDVGAKQMEALLADIVPALDSIFNPNKKEITSLLEKISSSESEEQKAQLKTLFETYPNIRSQFELAYFSDDPEMELELLANPDVIYENLSDEKYFAALNNVIDENLIDIDITGTSVVFTKGTRYLVTNLFISLMIAIVIIGILMSLLFRSARMVFVSLLPNFIPLIFTAAVMGYFGISIKPSTILVFSIAFGISIDDTIHFLAKYRQELKANGWRVRISVINALKEAGVSMVYTSIILFFGFLVFSASNFGGTQALGVLVSVTLLVAMLTNLVLLPSLLLSFENQLTKSDIESGIDIDFGDEEEEEEVNEELKTSETVNNA